ncbi:MAG: hypothetical protein A2086_03735 [Spirochaetes bacterium GWD1_27_9]|nr:MAG: hypothetical protein A2Z98_00270 [Spirochaetes bacterium GWB1_27_13]OHD20840.1 MAG: hypothetical protein A2Y34_12770 [Spirochaetes bacterium GWC1_27_15]OHD44598.1 MAG: hypothetical protein A2086_03735 [Spirochaetes bacterium GWD1_27_9]
MDKIKKDISKWIKTILELWRDGKKNIKFPEDKLTNDELNIISNYVKQISAGLTEKRELVGTKYLNNKNFLYGYLLFYWIISYMQLRFILLDVDVNKKSAIDFGCGPGPLSFALADIGVRNIFSLDNSNNALDFVSKLSSFTNQKIFTKLWDGQNDMDIPSGKFDVVTFGHIINELWKNDPDKIAKRVNLVEKIGNILNKDGIIIIIEPALHNTTKDLILLRNQLVEKGFYILTPCINKNYCNIVDKETLSCHTDFNWTPPKIVEQIANKINLKKDMLKMSFLVIKKETAEAEDIFRIISDPMLSKSGKIRFFICGKNGKFTLKSDKDFSHYEDFLSLKRGDLIQIKDCDFAENTFTLKFQSLLNIIKKNEIN